MYKRIAFLIIVFFLFQFDGIAQCAMCRTTVESTISNGRSNIATGLNTGILYLLAAPYLLVGVIAWIWLRQSKKEQLARISKWQLRQKVSQLMSK
jgi:polyferredoxin